jgi:hypothetical protein
MKRLIFGLLLGLLATGNAAQVNAQSYKEGIQVINAGIGVGYGIRYSTGSSITPLMSVSYEQGYRQVGPGTLGLGGIVSYQSASYRTENINGTADQRWSATYLGFRATWHPDILVSGEYDVYGGLQLGYTAYSYKYSGTGLYAPGLRPIENNLSSHIGLGLVVGGRYYFTPNIGAFAELGYDLAYVKIGAAFNF